MPDPNPIYELDGLYGLLPAIYRNRDPTNNFALRTLLRAIEGQVEQLVADIDQQYRNWFIETCADDLIPFFAELVGLSLGPSLLPSAAGSADGYSVWRRRQVANAIADRRRKGSFSVLEQLAVDATGWPARAVELGSLTLALHSIRFPEVGGGRLLDMRDGDLLDVLGTPLSTGPRLPDVRRTSSRRTPGTAPNGVEVSVWRLAIDRVDQAPAAIGASDSLYHFDQLGRDIGLAVDPVPGAAGTAPDLNLDVPVAITRAAFGRRTEDYYGPGRSICVFRGGQPVPGREIVVADLAGHRHAVPSGRVAIDPERGRIAFPARHPPDEGLSVSYSRLIVGPIGGGSYERVVAEAPPGATTFTVGTGAHHTVHAALDAWEKAKRKGNAGPGAVVEITDDGVYEERLEIKLAAGEHLVIRAAQGRRPVLVAAEKGSNRPDRVLVRGPEPSPRTRVNGKNAPGKQKAPTQDEPPADSPPPFDGEAPTVTLDGIWIGGHPLVLDGRLGVVTIQHCTLVPGATGDALERRHERVPSLIVRSTPSSILVINSVLGRIEVDSPEVEHDPVPLVVQDSIVAVSRRNDRAIEGADRRRAFASLTLERTTVLGGAYVDNVELIEDTILSGPLHCERRQSGSVRFSYLPVGSVTPRRTHCQPDAVRAGVEEAIRLGRLPESEGRTALERETRRVEPRFDDIAFGRPAFGRLSTDTAPEIVRGATDEGEMGAFHNLWQVLAVENLRTRIRDFAPAGTEIDIRFAT